MCVHELADFTNYSMKGRTYRYLKGDPLYSFGFGLSYSSSEYSGLSAKRTAKGAEIEITVKNLPPAMAMRSFSCTLQEVRAEKYAVFAASNGFTCMQGRIARSVSLLHPTSFQLPSLTSALVEDNRLATYRT